VYIGASSPRRCGGARTFRPQRSGCPERLIAVRRTAGSTSWQRCVLATRPAAVCPAEEASIRQADERQPADFVDRLEKSDSAARDWRGRARRTWKRLLSTCATSFPILDGGTDLCVGLAVADPLGPEKPCTGHVGRLACARVTNRESPRLQGCWSAATHLQEPFPFLWMTHK
jgi:hypothetical protein